MTQIPGESAQAATAEGPPAVVDGQHGTPTDADAPTSEQPTLAAKERIVVGLVNVRASVEPNAAANPRAAPGFAASAG